MKAIIKPLNNPKGALIMENLERLAKIFNNPIIRFSYKQALKAQIPRDVWKKYRRENTNFSLYRDGDKMIFSMPQNPTAPNSKKQILDAVERVILECDGTMQDVSVEVLL